MKYFLIVGEASGDLHAAALMRQLRAGDAEADFRFYGGDQMKAVGGTCLCHYKDLAYMGIWPVLRHLPTILKGMRRCCRAIEDYRPDAVVLVDYPGFNLKVARYVHERGICPVYYYISPKIWAWKEYRIKQLRAYVDRLYSILPFEPDYFRSLDYDATYVGNPTVDEVSAFRAAHPDGESERNYLALLPGSRRQEVKKNLERMLRAVNQMPAADALRLAIAQAPALPRTLYDDIIRRSGIDPERVEVVANQTYPLLAKSYAALVTSGTATLETCLFRVPQVVAYFASFGILIRMAKKIILKVKFISLVNLVAGREVVRELIADEMNVGNLRAALTPLLGDTPERREMLAGYDDVIARLGPAGAPQRAAADILARLKEKQTNA